MMATVFACRRCGHCCEGEGGIVVGPRDLERICAFLQISPELFRERYGVIHNGKLKIRTGADGYCIFFREGEGCRVHEGKPDICRAWPFFRGNMVDAESLYLAKDFCPGIRPDATHAEFVAEGRRYLEENALEAHDPSCEANALLKD